MWEMEIDLKDCERDGNIFTFVISPTFLLFFLGHKWKLNKGYPPFINVRGKKALKFDYFGMTGEYHLYKCNKFELHVRYNKKTNP